MCIYRKRLKFLIDFSSTKDYVRKKYFFLRKDFCFIMVNEKFFLSLKYYKYIIFFTKNSFDLKISNIRKKFLQ